MPFATQISYNRQLSQNSGTTEIAMFSGSTKIGQRLWVGLPDYSLEYGDGDYSYSGNSGYTFVVQQANYLGVVTGANGTNIYDDGRTNSYGVSITSYSGLTSGNTVLAIGQAPLHPVDLNAATITLTASSLQIAVDGLLTSGGDGDLELDTATGNVIYAASSKRYKYDINNINFTNLDKLLSLQTKTFKWKSNHKEDWGLIAEEVDELGFKELVNYSNGRPESIKYKKVALALLEYLKQYGSVNSPTTIKCECPKDEFIVLENDVDYTLDSTKTHKVIIKSLATCNVIPDNGLIDTQW